MSNMKVLTIDRGTPRGYYVFYTTDGGHRWLTEQRQQIRSKKQLDAYLEQLQKEMPKAQMIEHKDPEGRIPKDLWLDDSQILKVSQRLAIRRLNAEQLRARLPEPKRSEPKDDGPTFQHKSGGVEGVEVRRGFNFRSLSMRLEDDRPTVKTLQEWDRFFSHVDDMKKVLAKFKTFVEDSEEFKAKQEQIRLQVIKDKQAEIDKEVAKRMKMN